MRENLVLPPSIINNTIVGLSKDKMSTVWWNSKKRLFESAEELYTVAEVADAPTASEKELEIADLSKDFFIFDGPTL